MTNSHEQENEDPDRFMAEKKGILPIISNTCTPSCEHAGRQMAQQGAQGHLAQASRLKGSEPIQPVKLEVFSALSPVLYRI